MAVKTIDDYKCFRCGRTKGSINRWWLVKVEGAVFSFRDFQAHALEDYDYALCSMECLARDAQDHAGKIVGLKTAVESREEG